MKKITAIQEIVEYFKKLKGFDKIRDWDKHYFGRHVKAANDLLTICVLLVEAKQALQVLSDYFKEHGLDWTLETVIRKYPDLVAHNLKHAGREGKFIYYHKKDNWEPSPVDVEKVR